MTRLETAAQDYLALRRSVGFKLDQAGRLLGDFVAHLDQNGAETLTTALAVAWATSSPTPGQSARRLEAVRGFARYLQALDPATEVPPAQMLPTRRHRLTPYLYSDAEVVAIMGSARALQPVLWAATCETVIGLLSATGMRVGEVLRLERSDVSWDDGMLTVWFTKFGKSRHVPLAPSTLAALRAYDDLRRALRPRGQQSLFVSRGGRLDYPSLYSQFVRLLAAAGVAPHPGGRRQRLYDFRHSFAVNTVLEWYRQGQDVQALLPRLSTYLGHAQPASTYWYLSAAPELMALVAERLEGHARGWSS